MGARLSTTSAVFWEPPAPYEIQFVIKRDLHDQSHGSETTDWAKAFVDAHQETLFISNKTNVFPMDDKFGILVINEVSTECIGWKTEMLEYLRESGIYVFEDKENTKHNTECNNFPLCDTLVSCTFRWPCFCCVIGRVLSTEHI